MLAGRHALVTGASRGIGRSIAVVLARAGARVTLVARGAEALHDAVQEIGERATAVPTDLAKASAVEALVSHLEAAGALPDLLVNNAGLFPLASLDTQDVTAFEDAVRVNLIAPFLLVRALLPHMKTAQRGHVITIGSVADRHIFPGNGAYSATKYGQRAMHEVLVQELKSSGVRGTLVSPAATDTPIWDPIDPDNRPGFPPRASMLRPGDVADAVLWAATRPPHVNIDEIRLSNS
ncbi:MAG: SDR family oxidoreductase [Gemmatimonadaceae bacterium]|nr:SDR family oxidoreductase [Gemmatimonadaceae bacterium]